MALIFSIASRNNLSAVFQLKDKIFIVKQSSAHLGCVFCVSSTCVLLLQHIRCIHHFINCASTCFSSWSTFADFVSVFYNVIEYSFVLGCMDKFHFKNL